MHRPKTYPLHVFADTCVLRGQSPSSLALQRIVELAKAGRVCLHVSSVVEGELSSQLSNMITAPKRDIIRAAAWLPAEECSRFNEALSTLESIANNAKSLFVAGVADWLNLVEAVREELQSEHAKEVFKLYFAGEPPFNMPKNREDIPDAFVFVSIRSFSQKAQMPFHVVTADKRLRRSCESLKHVVVHETWESLLVLPELAVPLSASTQIGAFCRENWAEFVSSVTSALPSSTKGNEVILDFFDGKIAIGTLIDPGIVDSLDFDWADRFVYSDHTLSVPLNCKIKNCKVVFEPERSELLLYKKFNAVIVDDNASLSYIAIEFICDLHIEAEVAVEVVESLKDERTFDRIDIHHIESITVINE